MRILNGISDCSPRARGGPAPSKGQRALAATLCLLSLVLLPESAIAAAPQLWRWRCVTG